MLRRNLLTYFGAAVWAKAATGPSQPGVYVCATGSKLLIGSTAGGSARAVPDVGACSYPNLSPGARFVAFDENGGARAAIVDLKSGSRFPIPPGRRTWSPAENALLIEENGNLFHCSESNGWRVVLAARGATKATFDDTGSQFAFQEIRDNRPGPGGVPLREARLMRCWMSAASPGAAMPFYAKDLVELAPLGWSRDGSWVYYMEFAAGRENSPASLFRIPPVGGRGPRALALSVRGEAGMWEVSSNGEFLAAVTAESDNAGSELVVVKLTGELATRRISAKGQSVCHPTWSVKGDRIAYAACSANDARLGKGPAAQGVLARNRIWLAEANGAAAPKALTSDTRYRDEAPVFSGDGRAVLFCRTDRTGDAYIGSITDRGTNLRQVSPSFQAQPDESGRIRWGRWVDIKPTPHLTSTRTTGKV